MFSHMLSGIHGAVLSAGAAKTEHQAAESPLNIALHMGIGQSVHMIQECQYFAIFLQKILYGLVSSGQLFVLFIFARVVNPAAVEHISASVTGIVSRYSFFVGETENFHCQFSCIVF